MSEADRDRAIEEHLARYRQLIQQRWPKGQPTLDEIEQVVEEIHKEVSHDLERRILERQRPDRPRDNQTRCACGARARFRDDASRRLITIHGEHSWTRPYYHCAACECGFAPLDRVLGLDGGATTVQIRRWIARLASKDPFGEAAADLEEFTGVRLSVSHVERIAVAIGTSLGAAQRAQAQQHQAGQLPLPALRPSRLYVGIDGKIVPLREPWRRDGSQGPVVCRYAECKTAVVYEAWPGKEGDRGVRCKNYVATLGDVATFAPLVATLAHTHGHHLAQEVIVLGDGAAWIWLLVAAQFPFAIQILDYYHATEHLATVAHAQFGEGKPEAAAWLAAREAELLDDRVEDVLQAIAAWKPRSVAKRAVCEREYQYIASNAERMRYGTFREKGYHIGSGVAESACGHVVGRRLDQAGMHWRKENAEAIVCLRAALRSSDTPDLRPHCRMAA
jgi:hypothetical protein